MADQPLRGRKVAIFLAPAGTEQAEFTEPRKAVTEAGADVDVIGAETGPARTVNHDLDPGETFTVDKAFDQVSADDYDAVIVPGGTVGADKLRGNPAAVRFLRGIFGAGKAAGVICHGPWTLVEADVVRGRTLTSFPSLATDIRNAGGTWVDREVVADQGLVTSRNPGDLPAFCAAIVAEFAKVGNPALTPLKAVSKGTDMATASPSFGYFASSEELGPDEIIRAAQTAEAAGFDRLWVSDHYHPWMSEQGSSPFVWSVLGALAATTGLKLTTAVTCPTFRIHPAILAQATATTAVLAPGRFTFGVGSGEALNEHILGDAWPPVSVRHARLAEALDIIRQLWTGEVVTYEGTYFTVHDAKLFTRPQTPPDILVSGFGPEATRLAAQIGQGWISTSPDAEGMKIYRDAGGTGRTQAGAKICWAETEKEAKQTAHRLWGHQAGGGQLSQDAPMWMQYEAIAQLTSPDDIAETVPCGPDAAHAAEAIAEYVDAGFDEIYIAQMGPDQDSGIRFLAEEVLPLLNSMT